MTTYTDEELATRVLRDLGLYGAEETPSDADLQWTIETNSAEIASLSAIGIPVWNGSDLTIPQEYLTILSRRCGLAVAPSFGLVDLAAAQMAMREAERTLTMMASPRGAINPQQTYTNDAKPDRGSQFNFATGR